MTTNTISNAAGIPGMAQSFSGNTMSNAQMIGMVTWNLQGNSSLNNQMSIGNNESQPNRGMMNFSMAQTSTYQGVKDNFNPDTTRQTADNLLGMHVRDFTDQQNRLGLGFSAGENLISQQSQLNFDLGRGNSVRDREQISRNSFDVNTFGNQESRNLSISHFSSDRNTIGDLGRSNPNFRDNAHDNSRFHNQSSIERQINDLNNRTMSNRGRESLDSFDKRYNERQSNIYNQNTISNENRDGLGSIDNSGRSFNSFIPNESQINISSFNPVSASLRDDSGRSFNSFISRERQFNENVTRESARNDIQERNLHSFSSIEMQNNDQSQRFYQSNNKDQEPFNARDYLQNLERMHSQNRDRNRFDNVSREQTTGNQERQNTNLAEQGRTSSSSTSRDAQGRRNRKSRWY